MADSLSVRVESLPPESGVSFEQTMREAKYFDEASPNSFQKVPLNQRNYAIMTYSNINKIIKVAI